MQSAEARARAERFFRLHDSAQPLVVVDAWDAGSARILERAGAAAIGVSAGGAGWSLGLARDEMSETDFINACARICRVVRTPLSVDVDEQFAHGDEGLCHVVRALIELGVVGLNIEDGAFGPTRSLLDPAIMCERLARLRALATRMNARLFINARIDTYKVPNVNSVARYEETVLRARAYAAAGADGVFAPGLHVGDVVRFALAVGVPVTVDVEDRWGPPVFGLARAGVRRVSLGSGPLRSALSVFRRASVEAFSRGSYDTMNRTPPSDRDVGEGLGLWPMSWTPR